MKVLARGKSASAVAASAYICRKRRHDHRTGRRYGYAKRGGLISSGIVNWEKTGSALWNAAEKAEKRCNARTGREFKIALPAELTADQMLALVKSFGLHLKDKYGVASEYAIHAPRWLDERFGQRMEAAFARGSLSANELHQIRRDGRKTNRNFHAHIIMTTRSVDRETGAFGDKTRAMDDAITGPREVEALREEWTKRANAALKKAGHQDNVDLRSHDRRAAAGDGPQGLVSEPHRGPRADAECADVDVRNQRLHSVGAPEIYAVSPQTAAQKDAQRAAKNHNADVHVCWLELRRLERERARLLNVAAEIARQREDRRKSEAVAEIAAVLEARSFDEQQTALEAAGSIFAMDLGHGVNAIRKRRGAERSTVEDTRENMTDGAEMTSAPGEGNNKNTAETAHTAEAAEPTYLDVIADVEAGRAPAAAAEFEVEIDLETYVAPAPTGPPPTTVITDADRRKASRRCKQQVRC